MNAPRSSLPQAESLALQRAYIDATERGRAYNARNAAEAIAYEAAIDAARTKPGGLKGYYRCPECGDIRALLGVRCGYCGAP